MISREFVGTIPNKGYGKLKTACVTATSAAMAGATVNIPVQVPSGAIIIGASLRVDTLITSGDGSVAWSAAYNTGATQTLGSGNAFAKNTKLNTFFNVNAATNITSAATDITITATGGTFNAGVISAVVYYKQLVSIINNP